MMWFRKEKNAVIKLNNKRLFHKKPTPMWRTILTWFAVAVGILAFVFLWPRIQADADDVLSVSPSEMTVMNGDSFFTGGKLYQLAGIDAPELEQTCGDPGSRWSCGEVAFSRLKKLLVMQASPMTCYPDHLSEKSNVVSCFLVDEEVSEILLKAGVAVAAPDAEHHYVAAQHHARRASMGVWGGAFIKPWLWRQGQRLPGR